MKNTSSPPVDGHAQHQRRPDPTCFGEWLAQQLAAAAETGASLDIAVCLRHPHVQFTVRVASVAGGFVSGFRIGCSDGTPPHLRGEIGFRADDLLWVERLA